MILILKMDLLTQNPYDSIQNGLRSRLYDQILYKIHDPHLENYFSAATVSFSILSFW